MWKNLHLRTVFIHICMYIYFDLNVFYIVGKSSTGVLVTGCFSSLFYFGSFCFRSRVVICAKFLRNWSAYPRLSPRPHFQNHRCQNNGVSNTKLEHASDWMWRLVCSIVCRLTFECYLCRCVCVHMYICMKLCAYYCHRFLLSLSTYIDAGLRRF